MELVELTPDRLEEWLGFFDRDAFADNPEWGSCYCRCFLIGGGGPERWDAACAGGENRAAMIERIRAGEVDGLLARVDGKVVGWVQYGPTTRFHPPMGPLAPAEDDVASIVCFVVAAGHRRTGVARAMLRGACDVLARRGFRAVDARPKAPPSDGSGTHGAAEEFTGPLGLYLAEGFAVADDSKSRWRVRRELARA